VFTANEIDFTREQIEKSIAYLERRASINKELVLEALSQKDAEIFSASFFEITKRINELKEILK
jgi:hypothetical protein